MKRILTTMTLMAISLVCFAPNNHFLALYSPEPIYKAFTESDKLQAIILTETGPDGKGLYNRNEPQAVGILQEWPIMVYECNRILGYDKYTLNDRMYPAKAIEMFYVYQDYYNPTHDFETMCRIWCGGPDGMSQPGTQSYYKLALNQLNTL